MSLYYDFEFDAPITTHDVGASRYVYTVVFCPDDIARALPLREYPRLRIRGEIEDAPIEAALNPAGGRWYLLLSKQRLREIGRRVGDTVSVRFSVTDQDRVEIPALLADALASSPELRTEWDRQSAGMQRGLAYRITSAKREATQVRRLDEVIDILTGRRTLRTAPPRTGRRTTSPLRRDD